MSFEIHPLMPGNFDDFVTVANPSLRVNHCWCLSHRLTAAQMRELGDTREEALLSLCHRNPGPGVIGYDDGVPVAWCSIGPRSMIPRLEASKLIRRVDDVDVWAIICVVVRSSGFRKKGYALQVINGAVTYAAEQGAPAVETYPPDTDERIDTTMAFLGTRAYLRRLVLPRSV
ncbi:GNAT family N-acetyltransferase [Kocuria sp.]|uniref:GNAT family N-acetyltransferase n=1 Tax=Kocuria sp. TaxID=1871328 RepID=UPI0026E0A5C4|nr:GNAT family N-acetyltransferase [Kocuria sp.]MDO5619801.1 GNAT family N-acetyltransferase [Kocuria sp.]